MANITSLVRPEILEERRTTAMIFGVFSGLGVILNATPLILTYTTTLRNNFVYMFVSNLSAADLLLSAGFLFGNTVFLLYREVYSTLGCRLLGFVIFTTAYQEFVFPPLLSINRYISLYHNDVYHKLYTTRNMCIIIGTSWVLCAVMPLVFFFTHHTGYDTDNEHCCVTVVGDHLWTIIYWVVVIVPLVVFCDGTMLYCNTKMYKKLHSHAEGADTVKNNIMRRNKELMWFLWADMSLPICFHTVYHVLKFVIYNRQLASVRRFFAMLYLMNSCFRGVLTLTLLRPYRVKLAKILCCSRSKQKVAPAMALATAVKGPAVTIGGTYKNSSAGTCKTTVVTGLGTVDNDDDF